MRADSDETAKLLEDEAAIEERERRIAHAATEPAEERAARRRADKAAYLQEKLREREESEA